MNALRKIYHSFRLSVELILVKTFLYFQLTGACSSDRLAWVECNRRCCVVTAPSAFAVGFAAWFTGIKPMWTRPTLVMASGLACKGHYDAAAKYLLRRLPNWTILKSDRQAQEQILCGFSSMLHDLHRQHSQLM